jgi:Cys/Met metabolism PLP-dependent enzyme
LLCIPIDSDPFLGLIAGADLFTHAWRELGKPRRAIRICKPLVSRHAQSTTGRNVMRQLALSSRRSSRPQRSRNPPGCGLGLVIFARGIRRAPRLRLPSLSSKTARRFWFRSGLAAEASVLELLDQGSNDLYGGTWRLFHRVRQLAAGLTVTEVDAGDAAAVAAAITPLTRMIWVETTRQSFTSYRPSPRYR